MEKKSRVHVIKRQDGWVVKKEGALRASKKYTTKKEAVREATILSIHGYDLVIHRKDGTIEKWTKSKTG